MLFVGCDGCVIGSSIPPFVLALSCLNRYEIRVRKLCVLIQKNEYFSCCGRNGVDAGPVLLGL